MDQKKMKGLVFARRFQGGAFFFWGICLLSLGACVHKDKAMTAELKVVPYVDLKRYAGTWYEIARFPHRFQEGCVASRAIYTLQEDGKIGVLNECRKGSLDKEISSVRGKAKVVDPTTNAKLKVTFFWPFYGDYWIIDLGENYDYAVVGHPSRKYLWVLSRTPQMEEGLYQGILERLKKQGYDTSRLMKTQAGKEW